MLILCEKPSVAQSFAQVLDCKQNNGFFQNKNIIITYCLGHLFELAQPDEYDQKYKKWNIQNLPIIPEQFIYVKNQNVIRQINCVERLLHVHKNDKIIIATDAGREGELIARIVLMQSGITDISKCLRFWVSEALTSQVILSGIQNARPLANYNYLSKEAFARQHADWLVGLNLTRFMSIGQKTLFSVGRVQTAILSAIAQRNNEVKRFTPIFYTEIEAEITDGKTVVKAYLINPDTQKTAFSIKSEYTKEALALHDKKIDEIKIQQREKRNKPEKLLNITNLQKAAFKLYGYTPENTLAIAQTLYEKYKCLSYPRTPSRVMGDNNVELFRQKHDLLKPVYQQLAGFCNENLIDISNKHIFDSSLLEDHHALIPFASLPQQALEKEKNVFNIVVKSFFTVCMDDYVFNEKKLLFKIDRFVFLSVFKEIINEGWKKSLSQKDPTEDYEKQIVNVFNEQNATLLKTCIVHKKTSPKKDYSIDTLLTFMENPQSEEQKNLAGLGTPATRAAIIKILFDREYIVENGKKLCATEKGVFLLEQLQKSEYLAKITNVAQTTEWEQQLKDNPDAFEKAIKEFVIHAIDPSLKEKYVSASAGLCPLCGGEIREGKLNFYCVNYKNSPQCTFTIWKNTHGSCLCFKDIELLLSKKKTKLTQCKSKAGKSFKAYLELDGKEIKLSFPKRETKKQ